MHTDLSVGNDVCDKTERIGRVVTVINGGCVIQWASSSQPMFYSYWDIEYYGVRRTGKIINNHPLTKIFI